jgi:hypothetical protein
MIDAAVGLLRSFRRSIGRLLMLLLCRLFLLMLLLLLRLAVLLFLLLALCVGRSNGSDKKEQNSRADESTWPHDCCLYYRDLMRPTLVRPGAIIISEGDIPRWDWITPP